ncbi:MAG TPA: Gfo/Idh/MocA family oxidoreductase [Gaiellaceae bacterium]|nr:Gfo/Idh/MocA family oxidoreductase [Gaiellaceae bacterium]
MKVALVGAGAIATPYATCIVAEPRLELAGATDVSPGRADELVAVHGGTAYPSLDDLLADDSVELVVNLTPAARHAEITRICLEGGKHVHSEKPIALEAADAWALVELARDRGLRLSCAPATVLGEAQQTAWKLVREGELGHVRAVYAEANWGRIETWHPAPEAFYAVGPLVDVGIYPLTILTAMFGPVRRVTGFASTLLADRRRVDGEPFSVGAADFWVAALELADGIVVRLTASFWVGGGKARGLEVFGDEGSLWMSSWLDFDSPLELSRDGNTYAPVAVPETAYRGIDWARALVEVAEAIEQGRPHRLGAEHGAHVVEVLNAVERSCREGGPVDVHSSFPSPEPL